MMNQPKDGSRRDSPRKVIWKPIHAEIQVHDNNNCKLTSITSLKMRLTLVLRTLTEDSDKLLPPKLFWSYGKGFWGPRKVKYTWLSDFKFRFKKKKARVYDTEAEKFVPPGVTIHDARTVGAVYFHEKFPSFKERQVPWPFLPDFVPKSKDDPSFQERPALLFSKHFTLYEGFKGAAVFTNSVFEEEEGLPSLHKDLESKITVDETSLKMLDRKLNYATDKDCALIKLPAIRTFPKMNIKPVRVYGIHPYRRDISVLKAFQLTSDMMISRRYDFLDRRIIDWPACVVALEREGHRVVLDLKTEFVTVSKDVLPKIESPVGEQQEASKKEVVKGCQLPVFASPETTFEKELFDVSPADWKINFDEVNFYPDRSSWKSGIKLPYKTHTLFLTNNVVNPKPQPDRFVKGRCLLYLYGHAVAQARQLFGVPEDETDAGNYKDLPSPVMVQGVYYNSSKNNMGFMTFQLNTTQFDSKLKNQVWSDGPYDLATDQEVLLKKLTALNLAGADSGLINKVN